MAITIPGSVNGSQSYALFNPLDLYRSDIYEKLVGRVPHVSSLTWLRNLKGRTAKRRVRRHTYSFYQEGQFFKASAKIAAVATSGANFLITLDAADHGNVGGTGKSSYPVVGDSVMFADGRTTGYVSAIDRTTDGAHVLTVKKWNSAQDIATVATVGSMMVFTSNIQKEKSTKTESRVPVFEKVTNYIQTFREGFEVTDHEMQNAAWFKTDDGKDYLWYKGANDTGERFELQTEYGLMTLPQASGLTDAGGNSLTSVAGLFPTIEASGSVVEYYDTPDGAAFDEIMITADNAYGDKKYVVQHGMNLMLGLKNMLVEYAKNGTGNISFSPFSGGATEALKLNFKSYSVGSWEFYFNECSAFSHKDSLGADGLPFRHYGIFIPAGMTKDTNPDRSSSDPEYVPYIIFVTPEWGRPLGNIDKGDYLMWETGALAAGGPTNDEASAYVHYLRYAGLEVRCANKFLEWRKA